MLDVVGLVQDWHLEYQNGPLVVVDRYLKPMSCSGIEERVTQFDHCHLNVVTACLTESLQPAVYPPT